MFLVYGPLTPHIFELIVENVRNLTIFNTIQPYLILFNPIHTEFDNLCCFVANLVLSKFTHFFTKLYVYYLYYHVCVKKVTFRMYEF